MFDKYVLNLFWFHKNQLWWIKKNYENSKTNCWCTLVLYIKNLILVVHIVIHYTPRKRSCGGIYWSLCPSVRPSLRPSQSLIRYSSKTAEQNFMKLSGIVHYMMPYCTSCFKFLSAWFLGFPEQNKDFAIQNIGERGVSFCEHCSQYF